jgi:hypothetical protein
MTTWSLTHNDAKPAASSARAISGIPISVGYGPLFGTFAPSRIDGESRTNPLIRWVDGRYEYDRLMTEPIVLYTLNTEGRTPT